MLNRRELLIAASASGLLAACGGGEEEANASAGGKHANAYRQTNLVCNDASANIFKPTLTDVDRHAEFLNAWGMAIRPAGAGGHFWIGAGGWSYQFVGDVGASADARQRTLFQDALTLVRIPGAGVPAGETDVTNVEKFVGFTTGVVFNGAALTSEHFVVRGQKVTIGGMERTLEGSARFLFATDSGVISGWTERDPSDNGIVRTNGSAVALIDGSAEGQAYFGLALRTGAWDQLWAADFGKEPQIRAWDKTLAPIDLAATGTFANPFIGNKLKAKPGDYVPFNIQVLTVKGIDYVFVAYAKSQPNPADPTQFLAGEEDAVSADHETLKPDRGRVAMFDLNGRLIKVFDDKKKLNAPWGLAVAPEKFGPVSGMLLVGNFGGTGRVAAFDIERGLFMDYLRTEIGTPVKIEGLWGLQFGNGASLGDTNALYFSAGPTNESQGLFGVLRHAE